MWRISGARRTDAASSQLHHRYFSSPKVPLVTVRHINHIGNSKIELHQRHSLGHSIVRISQSNVCAEKLSPHVDCPTTGAGACSMRSQKSRPPCGDRLSCFDGVSDGTRTRDTQDHNLVLYQLNYTHHHCVRSALTGLRISSGANTSESNRQLRIALRTVCRDPPRLRRCRWWTARAAARTRSGGSTSAR